MATAAKIHSADLPAHTTLSIWRLSALNVAVLATLSSLLASHAAIAQTTAQQNESVKSESANSDGAKKTLPTVTVTSTRTENEVDEAPATVTVVTAREIEQRQAQDLRDLLRYEPNVSMGNSPARFGLTGINIRGIEGNRILMQVDGVRLPDQFSIGSFAFATRDTIDPDLLKSAELLRGPGSSLYGSDALGGVVSFFTKDPSDFLQQTPRSVYAAVKAQGSQVDSGQNGSVTFAGGRNWPVQVLLHGNRREGNETENFGTLDTRGATRTKPNPQSAQSTNGLAKVVWNGDKTTALTNLPLVRLTLESRETNTKTDVATLNNLSPKTVNLVADDSTERQRAAVDVEWSKLGPLTSLRANLYQQDAATRQKTNERRDATTGGCSGVTTGTNTCLRAIEFAFDQDVVGGGVQAVSTIDGKHLTQRLSAGIDFSRTRFAEQRDGTQTIITATGMTTVSNTVGADTFPVRDFPKSTSTQTGIYLQNEMFLLDGNLTITPSVRYDRFKLSPELDDIFAADNVNVPVTGLSDQSVSPRVGVVWKVLPAVALYGQFARGFRAPPYNDVNFGFTNFAGGYTAIPNANLKPERSRGVEYGVRFGNDWANLSVTGFSNRYSDFIASLTQLNCPGDPQCSGVVPITFQSINIGRVKINGWELRGRVLFDTFVRGLSANVSVGTTRGDNLVSNTPLDSVDPRKTVFGTRYDAPSGAFGVELIASNVATKKRVASATQFRPPGYTLLDANVYWTPIRHVELVLGVTNISDKKVWQWSDVRGLAATSASLDRFTQPGRQAAASVKLVF